MRFRWMLLALLLAFAHAALWAGPLEDGLAAYNAGDYATALRLLPPLAGQGYAAAQFNLGQMYDQGLGVSQDYAQAAKWYRMAAERGHVQAQHELGWLYDEGRRVSRDYVQAYLWYSLAAAQGDEVAAHARDSLAARMSAGLIARAQYELGWLYDEGKKVHRDYVQSYVWYSLAAAQGDEQAAKNQQVVAARMTPAQVAEAQKLAREGKAKGM